MKVNIKDLKKNPNNPRNIRGEKKEELICSLLTFPEMLEYRDIVVDEDNVILGGNQRFQALLEILKMSENTIKTHLRKCDQGEEWAEEKLRFWMEWKQNPTVSIEVVSLTDEERKEFIIKDNADFGEWNNEKLNMFYEDIMNLPTMIINEDKVVFSENVKNEPKTNLTEEREQKHEELVSHEEKDAKMSEIESFGSSDRDMINEVSSSDEFPEKVSEGGSVIDETIHKEIGSIGNNEPNIAQHIEDDFVDYAIINGEKIPVTRNEFDSFMDRLSKYREEYGSSIGFINFLKNGIRKY